MIEEQGTQLIHVLISLAVLLFAAKLFAEIFHIRLAIIKNIGHKNYVKNDSQTSELLLILAYH
jgi:hypothetical protein